MTSITVANPDMVSLAEQINICSGTHMQLVNTKTFFSSTLVNKCHQKPFAFSWHGQLYIFTAMSQVYIDRPGL